MYVLTADFIEYDQHGEYLVVAFNEKPNVEALSLLLKNPKLAQRLVYLGHSHITSAMKPGEAGFHLRQVNDAQVFNPELFKLAEHFR